MTVLARCGASKQARIRATTTRRISPTSKRFSNGFLCVKYTQRVPQLNVLTVVERDPIPMPFSAHFPPLPPLMKVSAFAGLSLLSHSHTRTQSSVPAFCIFIAGRRTGRAWRGLAWPGLAWRAREMQKQPFYVFVASAHDSRQRRRCPGAAPAADAACSLLLQPYKFSQFTLLSRTFIAFNLLTSHLKLFFSPSLCTLLSPFLLNLLTRTHTLQISTAVKPIILLLPPRRVYYQLLSTTWPTKRG